MPDYNYGLNIPANTTKESPVSLDLTLARGVVAGGQMYFPAGCHYLAHVAIVDGIGKVYPANAEEWIQGNAGPVPLVGRYILDAAPFKLKMLAWNEDDTYDHEVQLTLNVLTAEETNLSIVLLRLEELLNEIKRLLTGTRIS